MPDAANQVPLTRRQVRQSTYDSKAAATTAYNERVKAAGGFFNAKALLARIFKKVATKVVLTKQDKVHAIDVLDQCIEQATAFAIPMDRSFLTTGFYVTRPDAETLSTVSLTSTQSTNSVEMEDREAAALVVSPMNPPAAPEPDPEEEMEVDCGSQGTFLDHYQYTLNEILNPDNIGEGVSDAVRAIWPAYRANTIILCGGALKYSSMAIKKAILAAAPNQPQPNQANPVN